LFGGVEFMRQRNKPWAKDKLLENPTIVIAELENCKGSWNEKIFKNNNPIYLEVGTGKGQFITGLGEKNPDTNYIGFELQTSVIVSALDKILESKLENVKLINNDAQKLADFFAKGELSRVYLNFSDPWPKNRHDKRRLTHHNFLKLYQSLLKEDGEIHFKTDNQHLFEFSLESFSSFGMVLKNISLDLHKSDFIGNVMTEYEEKFSEKGNPIYRCEAMFVK
jgi:tRNA (guanine-N7-)-methyltransferase